MFDKFEKVFEERHSQGFLTSRRPEAHQCHNMDEIGFDSSGKWDKVIRFLWNNQRYTLGTGEKAPFWTTALVTTCANGQFPMPPVVIHQGKEGQLSEHLMMCASLENPDGPATSLNSTYLPGNWIVYQVRFPRIFDGRCLNLTWNHALAEPTRLQRLDMLREVCGSFHQERAGRGRYGPLSLHGCARLTHE